MVELTQAGLWAGAIASMNALPWTVDENGQKVLDRNAVMEVLAKFRERSRDLDTAEDASRS
jgi:hypothetical protein